MNKCLRTLAAAVALASIASCGSADTQAWSKADVFFVTSSSDGAVLWGADVDGSQPTPFVAVNLADVDVNNVATSSVSYSGSGPVLAWTGVEVGRSFAVLDTASQIVKRLQLQDDSGVVWIGDGRLVAATAASRGPSVLQTRTLAGRDLRSSRPLGVSPLSLTAGPEGVVVVGSTADAGAVLQISSADLLLSTPTVVATRSLPGQVATVPGASVVALNRRVPAGVSLEAKASLPLDNRVAIVRPGSNPTLVETAAGPWGVTPVDDRTVCVDGTADGRRVIQFIDTTKGTVTRTVPLSQPDPVSGIAVVRGRVVVLQSGALTTIDARGGQTLGRAVLDQQTETVWTSARS